MWIYRRWSNKAHICVSSTTGEKRSKPIGNETDQENVYKANFKILNTFSSVLISLTQDWVKKDLNLYIMYQ